MLADRSIFWEKNLQKQEQLTRVWYSVKASTLISKHRMYASINTNTSSFYLQPDLRCPFGFINDIPQQNHIRFRLSQSLCASTLSTAPILGNTTITLPDLQEEEEEMVNKPADEECNCAQFSKVRVPKDKHRKIVTAQGLRDRRVRLSIGIARKFFDLHDMLGFDKASKTVEWLFTKSQRAINEMMLLSSYSLPSTNFCPDEGCKVTRFNVGNSAYPELHITSSLDKKAKKQTTSRKVPIQGLSKEKRKMARERARARTKEKLCAKRKFDEPKKCSEGTNSADFFNVQSNLDQNSHKEALSELPSREDRNKKLTPSSIFNYQANNWDISGVVTQSSFICRNSRLWQAVEGIQQSSKSIEMQDMCI